MREIKFRGLEIMTGHWVYGNHVQTGVGMHYIIPRNFIADVVPQWHVDKESVGQYTGVKDKNGKQIFEGDIVVYSRVQYTDCSRTVIEAKAPPVVGEVYYADSVWLGLKNSNGSGRILMPGTIDNGEFEIIGNIYENPELLEA